MNANNDLEAATFSSLNVLAPCAFQNWCVPPAPAYLSSRPQLLLDRRGGSGGGGVRAPRLRGGCTERPSLAQCRSYSSLARGSRLFDRPPSGGSRRRRRRQLCPAGPLNDALGKRSARSKFSIKKLCCRPRVLESTVGQKGSGDHADLTQETFEKGSLSDREMASSRSGLSRGSAPSQKSPLLDCKPSTPYVAVRVLLI